MFDRAAQVNAQFAGGSIRQEEVVAALHALGVPAGQVTVIARADAGDSHAPAAVPGWFTRLKGLFVAERETTALLPDMLVLVHLGQDDTLAGPVEEVLHRFGATRVEHYAPSRVPTRIGVAGVAAPGAAAEPGEAGWEDDGGGPATTTTSPNAR